ncbi:hypothetical protein D3C72_1717290 [compost metagenome]
MHLAGGAGRQPDHQPHAVPRTVLQRHARFPARLAAGQLAQRAGGEPGGQGAHRAGADRAGQAGGSGEIAARLRQPRRRQRPASGRRAVPQQGRRDHAACAVQGHHAGRDRRGGRAGARAARHVAHARTVHPVRRAARAGRDAVEALPGGPGRALAGRAGHARHRRQFLVRPAGAVRHAPAAGRCAGRRCARAVRHRERAR